MLYNEYVQQKLKYDNNVACYNCGNTKGLIPFNGCYICIDCSKTIHPKKKQNEKA